MYLSFLEIILISHTVCTHNTVIILNICFCFSLYLWIRFPSKKAKLHIYAKTPLNYHGDSLCFSSLPEVRFHPEFLISRKKTSSGIASVQVKEEVRVRSSIVAEEFPLCSGTKSTGPCASQMFYLKKSHTVTGQWHHFQSWWNSVEFAGRFVMQKVMLVSWVSTSTLGIHDKGIKNNFLLNGHHCVEFWGSSYLLSFKHYGPVVSLPWGHIHSSAASKAGGTLLHSAAVNWVTPVQSKRVPNRKSAPALSLQYPFQCSLDTGCYFIQFIGNLTIVHKNIYEDNISRRPCQTKPKISSMGHWKNYGLSNQQDQT